MKDFFHRKLVLIGASALALVWAIAYLRQSPVDDPDWLVRLTIGILLAFGLLASRPSGGHHHKIEPGLLDRYPLGLPLLAAGAALLSVLGLIVPIRQFEWLGLVLLLFAAVRWALPMHYRNNVLKAFFLFYWVHPLPGQIFGPFQMWMQQMSVVGSEWLLHILNHRLWADGFILRLGTAEFGVPEACSGMRTAVTVLLCTLGVGMLLRMRWYDTLAFLVLGTLQVLALNILRISVIVHLATRSAVTISETVLHDTAGIFLLISIMLVQGEMVWWRSFSSKRRRLAHARAIGEAEQAKRSSFLPPFWRSAVRSTSYVLVAVFFAGAISLALYKRRPSHRAEMIKGVIESLLREQPGLAARAVTAARQLTPDDRELGTFMVQALVRDEHYEAALREIETLPRPLNYMERAMQSLALAATGNIEDAAVILTALPSDVQRWPGMAIFRAEYAARVDDVSTAAEYVRYAARSHITLPRVRALYPYLGGRGQWMAIAETHHSDPYQDVGQALIAIHANMSINRREVAGRILRQAVDQWPDEIQLLSKLADFAARHPDSEWENHFESRLLAQLDELDTDQLSALIGHTFGMHRPDLAWRLWDRLAELDESDPALYLTAARHAGDWFLFRRRRVGMSAMDARATVDMRDTYRERRDEPGFQPHWGRVPLVDPMTTRPVEQLRIRYLEMALAELERRELAGEMTERLDKTFPVVLGMLGRTDEAHERLDILGAAYPEMLPDVLLQHALNYERRAQWHLAYESLRQYFEKIVFAGLRPRLMYINAALNSGLGQMAMRAAMDAVDEFPDSPEARLALAMVWDSFGFKEQALFIMAQSRETRRSPFYPQLLHDTGRFNEAARMARGMGYTLRDDLVPSSAPRVVPAEFALRRRASSPITDDQMALAKAAAGRWAEDAESEFIRDLRRLEAEWFAVGGEGAAVSDPEHWMAIGRDDQEKAAAVYNLAALLLQMGEKQAARSAIDHALEFTPDCVALWRYRVGLAEGEPDILAVARERFPDDPEFWLADLVVRVKALSDDSLPENEADALRARIRDDIERAAKNKQFAPGDMVRAADLLLRHELYKEAEPAARYGIAEGQGLETAYVIGLRCALQLGDMRWALSCVLGGVDHALEPKPFYEMLVNLNFARGALDRDLVVALNYLQNQFPEETGWTEQLGYVHFRQGDPGRALSVLSPIIRRDDIGRVRIATLALAAESARLDGRAQHAVSILEAGLASHPDDITLLNNLIYTLVDDPKGINRALQRLPELVRVGGETAEVLNTIGLVYLRSGQIERSERFIKKSLEKSVNNEYSYPLIRATDAELSFAKGDLLEGLRKTEEILGNGGYVMAVRQSVRLRMEPVVAGVLPGLLVQAREKLAGNDIEGASAILTEIIRNSLASAETKRESRSLLEQIR